jgi:hypothetical protein
MFKAEIVADSLSPQNHRLTTFLVTFPRIVLAEFNTHRVLSRNSASSRAIPFKKMLKAVLENPFVPLRWQKDHSGMQGTEYFDDNEEFYFLEARNHVYQKLQLHNGPEEDKKFIMTMRDILIKTLGRLEFTGKKTLSECWLVIRDIVVECAVIMYGFGVSKQICNRLLEPFMWHTVLVTGTEWENFFALRNDPSAEIHMQHIAHLILEAYNASSPNRLKPGEWHIPYMDQIDGMAIRKYLVPEHPHRASMDDKIDIALKISTMMCARTSYTLPGDDLSEWTVEKYLKKYDEMHERGHMSPFEHCAQCPTEEEYYSRYNGYVEVTEVTVDKFVLDGEAYKTDRDFGWWGNFHGWKQLRKLLSNENRSDSRVKKHTY